MILWLEGYRAFAVHVNASQEFSDVQREARRWWRQIEESMKTLAAI